ncbi:MAG: DedA family protein [Deltaproteobacteria bacterium]|nr:DedA family protein [Deltaproteobacteria bacterium]MBI3753046.1 DedA family protein [Deltaproteobacteria bacterium]
MTETIFQIVLHMSKTVTAVVEMTGYSGIVFLMALESTMVPLPSELIMPFAGFLAAEARLNMWFVILFGGAGSLAGSLISYFIGRFGGAALVRNLGKYLLLDEGDLETSERWFSKYGEITIIICRFVPVVRHFISIPAGVARMDLRKFCLYTIIGATTWNAILAYSGYLLRENWESLHHYMRPISIAVFFVFVILVAVFFYKHIAKKIVGSKQ